VKDSQRDEKQRKTDRHHIAEKLLSMAKNDKQSNQTMKSTNH
jgi:hypothetical protein